MRTEQAQIRSASMAATVTTLVALVAVASTTVVGVMPRASHGHGEQRATMIDGQAVRCVAGAIVAAARDLLTSGQPDSVLPALMWTDELDRPVAKRNAPAISPGDPVQPLLSERLLDLPPPVC